MATSPNTKSGQGHFAAAKALNIPVSTKHCIEICRTLRFKDVSFAKQFLADVSQLKRPVEFKRFLYNTGHKRGMSTGRYPAKAASEILKLLKSVEANAHFKGLNTGSLKITKFMANRAPNPYSGGRHRTHTKRTHVEIEVKERALPAHKTKGKEAAAPTKKKESVPAETTAKHEHAHDHTAHDHAHEAHEHPAAPKQKHEPAHHEEKPAMAKPSVKPKVAEEMSSSELLKKVQQKAAEMNRREKERKDTEQVTNLYEELQKKGSLRSPEVRK